MERNNSSPDLKYFQAFIALTVLVATIVLVGGFAYRLNANVNFGKVTAVDTTSACTQRNCRFLLTTEKGEVNVVPGAYKIGDSTSLSRSVWNGTTVCVEKTCARATVFKITDESLRKELNIMDAK